MAKVGKFLLKHFKDREVELYCGIDREWINYSDSSTINGTVIKGVFDEYDEDCGIIVMRTLDRSQHFFISEDYVEMLWAPGFSILENSITIMNTGQKEFNRKNRDIM